MSTPTLVIEDLRKAYGTRHVVDGVSLAVAPGEIVGLLGPNGAGKSTTVECAIGLRRPDGGTIQLSGQSACPPSGAQRARIGVQLQSTGLFGRLSVRETLELFAALVPRPVALAPLMERLALGSFAERRPATLSGGQRQRLTLALALISDPELLVLDEPTTAMDPQARRIVWELIAQEKRRGKAILLTTHAMEEAAHLADRIAIMDHGRIIAEGAPEALVREHFTTSAVEFVAPPSLNETDWARVPGVERVLREGETLKLYTRDVPATISRLMTLSADGPGLAQLTVRSATLDDLFLELTGRAIRGEEVTA